MKDLDDRLRDALGGLRRAPVPSTTKVRAASPEPRSIMPALSAAAAMLLLLAASLFFMPPHSIRPEAALADRIAALETRISRIEDEELRSLMGRELALLRRELELARQSP